MRRGDAAAPRVPGVRLTYSELRVVGCETVTPRMRRVTLAGLDDVAGWYQRYLAMPDDRRPWMRTYSIRRHRPAARWAAPGAP